MITLLNRSNTRFRIFDFHTPASKAFFMPHTTRELSDELAQKLLKMFPNEIITVASLSADLVSGDEPKVAASPVPSVLTPTVVETAKDAPASFPPVEAPAEKAPEPIESQPESDKITE